MSVEAARATGTRDTGVEQAPMPLRTMSHPTHVKKTYIGRMLNMRKIKEGAAGKDEIEAALDPNSKEAQSLMRELGWEELKFVFPATYICTWSNESVGYLQWDSRRKAFSKCYGGVSIMWRDYFRTVHKV